ncbi:MAG: FixH family protein [Thioalkalispiraceae bacterium]
MNTQTIQPWYRQFWPWFLIAFPATAVIAGIATIIIAVKTDDGLVEDDYYKAGLAINRTLQRRQVASQLGLKANAHWEQPTGILTLSLDGKLTAMPARLDMTLLHPTRAHLDKKIKLYAVPDKSSYTGRMELIESGNWHVILEPENNNWRLSGRINQAQQASWSLQPE